MQSSVANAPRAKTSRFQVWRSLERDAGAAVTAISSIRKLGQGSVLLLHQQGLGPRSYPLRHHPWQALHDCPSKMVFPFAAKRVGQRHICGSQRCGESSGSNALGAKATVSFKLAQRDWQTFSNIPPLK